MSRNEDIPSPDSALDESPSRAHDVDLAILSDLLQEYGVETVVIHYEGAGDPAPSIGSNCILREQ